MRKALRQAGISPGEMAAYLGVGGNTVSTWINGRITPSVQTLRLWALRTGVSLEWLAGDQFPRRRGFIISESLTPATRAVLWPAA